MRRNNHRTFSDIHGSENRLIDRMIRIQHHVVRHERCKSWAQSLRFIRVPNITVDELPILYRAPITLQLTGKRDHPGVTNYVAVSYCWNASSGGRATFFVQSGDQTWPSRAPSIVLERAISYAVAHRVPFIWIDQECIEQDNPDDKGPGVQVMDLVYRQAEHSIGLLNVTIQSQEMLDALEELSQGRSLVRARPTTTENNDPLHACTVLFRHMLAADLWFSRSWIYQESCCARKNMVLLMRHARGIKHQQKTLGSIPQEAQLPVTRCEHMFRWDVLHPILPSANLLKSEYVSEAVRQLRRRKEKMVQDRLAILSNVCDFPLRLDGFTLETFGYDYSTSLLVLALINGDTSPFGYFSALASTSDGEGPSWMDTNVDSFLQGAGVNRTYWANHDGNEPRLFPPVISRQGLQTRGWLWLAEEKIDLEEFRHRHIETLKTFGFIKRPYILQELVFDLIQELEGRDYPQLVDALWKNVLDQRHLYQPSTPDKKGKAIAIASHQQVRLWCSDVPIRLLDHIFRNGFIMGARLSGEDKATAIFYCEAPTCVFTSTSRKIEDIEGLLGRYNFVSLEVQPDGVTLGGVLRILPTRKWTHGIWHAPSSKMERCLFAWRSVGRHRDLENDGRLGAQSSKTSGSYETDVDPSGLSEHWRERLSSERSLSWSELRRRFQLTAAFLVIALLLFSPCYGPLLFWPTVSCRA